MIIGTKGTEAFDFTSLLHTYFRVSNIANVKLEGLQGVEYKDKVGFTFPYFFQAAELSITCMTHFGEYRF